MTSIYKFFIFSFILLISCEKDDICIEGSDNTKKITIGFLDNETKNPKGISLESVRGIDNDSILEELAGNTIKLPLKVNKNKTTFIMKFNSIEDTLEINHFSIHKYLNRSCGFISNFLIKSSTEISKNSGWIKEVSIENDSIFNEEKTNIYIHF